VKVNDLPKIKEYFYRDFCKFLKNLVEMIKFCKHVGEEGAELLLKLSIDLYPEKERLEKEVLLDATVQEKNITYPTDVKLQKKIIEKCRKITKVEGIQL
jgi:transposase, IS5 family